MIQRRFRSAGNGLLFPACADLSAVQGSAQAGATFHILSEFSRSPFFESPCLTARLRGAVISHYVLALIFPDDITSVIKFIVNNGYLNTGRPIYR